MSKNVAVSFSNDRNFQKYTLITVPEVCKVIYCCRLNHNKMYLYMNITNNADTFSNEGF